MNVGELYRQWTETLRPLVGADEAVAIARLAFEHYLSMKPVDIVVRADYRPEPTTVAALDAGLAEIKSGRPVQYVVGEAWFHGLRLKVGPGVLIPRKETSQLVDIIEKDFEGREELRVIDLCSGSGAIALALARALPYARVTAVELSEKALGIARENARRLKCDVKWLRADVLDSKALPAGSFDIIVANPPYIPYGETSQVDPIVLDNEPREALFVPDDDPLVFYKAISHWVASHLDAAGTLYFEINPHFAREMSAMLRSEGFGDVVVEKDFTGKERFVIARL